MKLSPYIVHDDNVIHSAQILQLVGDQDNCFFLQVAWKIEIFSVRIQKSTLQPYLLGPCLSKPLYN